MLKITTSVPFREKVIAQAEKMLENGVTEEDFTDEKKAYEGLRVFIDKKPISTLFSFSFPEGSAHKDKKIFVGNDK